MKLVNLALANIKASGGYKLGDAFTITSQDKDYSYRVAGFFEATMLGMNNMGMIKFFLPDEAYAQLSAKLGVIADGTMMSTIFMDPTQSPRLLVDYKKQFPQLNEGISALFSWANDS